MLTPKFLVAAYANGFFPMAVAGEIEWFSPDPRAILLLEEFRVSKNLARRVRGGRFEIRLNTCFEQIVRECANRPEGTWISEEIIETYTQLHRRGWAHSVESWRGDELAGGLYGVAIGGAFFGESMFHRETDASKVALVALVDRLRRRGFALLDVQFLTPHLARFGAREIPRRDYLARLRAALAVRGRFLDDAAG